ncbi:hypothetical protein AAHB34_18335 [Paenarthrobacter ureafaciens]
MADGVGEATVGSGRVPSRFSRTQMTTPMRTKAPTTIPPDDEALALDRITLWRRLLRVAGLLRIAWLCRVAGLLRIACPTHWRRLSHWRRLWRRGWKVRLRGHIRGRRHLLLALVPMPTRHGVECCPESFGWCAFLI